MKAKELQDFLKLYKDQKTYLDKEDNYSVDGKSFIDWYLESHPTSKQSKSAEHFYEGLENKKDFTKLVSTGINTDYKNIFEFAESYKDRCVTEALKQRESPSDSVLNSMADLYLVTPRTRKECYIEGFGFGKEYKD